LDAQEASPGWICHEQVAFIGSNFMAELPEVLCFDHPALSKIAEILGFYNGAPA
jgi:hypothetical protein